MGRLRAALRDIAIVTATKDGFALLAHGACKVVILAPPVEEKHAPVLALLADGESWSSSALAQALHTSPRTVVRALASLAAAGTVQAIGHGRSRRWMTPPVVGYPTALLLPGPLPGD
jgi:DNA-binding MarR family transcriptional regulator